MRSRYPSASSFSYSFGPGPLTPAIKVLIAANVIAFLVDWILNHALRQQLGLRPEAVFEQFAIWQPFTYMFLHAGAVHLLFNMLAIWMFGVELERMWGSSYFIRYYLIAGLGAAATQLLLSIAPVTFADQMYGLPTVGASGAVFGLLLAYGLYFPTRPILFFLVFPIPAKYFVMIIGAMSLFFSMGGPGGGVAHAAHLGGLVTGYLYLKGGRYHPLAELKYRYLKWRINRMRRKFDVYSGGRADDVNRRVH